MLDRALHACFTAQSRDLRRIHGGGATQHLDRDFGAQSDVLGRVHDADAAGADLAQNAVFAAEHAADHVAGGGFAEMAAHLEPALERRDAVLLENAQRALFGDALGRDAQGCAQRAADACADRGAEQAARHHDGATAGRCAQQAAERYRAFLPELPAHDVVALGVAARQTARVLDGRARQAPDQRDSDQLGAARCAQQLVALALFALRAAGGTRFRRSSVPRL